MHIESRITLVRPLLCLGFIARQHVRAGETIAAGSLLCQVETDKATVGFEFQDEAVLAKILVDAEGAEIKIGTPIAITVDDDEAYAAFVAADAAGLVVLPGAAGASQPAADGGAVDGGSAAASAAGAGGAPPGRTVSDEFLLLPSTAHLAASKGIDVSGLAGSGKGGRITKGDVLEALARGVTFPPKKYHAAPAAAAAAAPAAASVAPPAAAAAAAVATPPAVAVASGDVALSGAPFEEAKASTMRKVIAKRLTQSKAGVPHLFASVECELDAALAFRKALDKDHGVKVSVNDLIIRSAALALRDVPELNACFDEKLGSPVLNTSVDVSVAVATPGGLITPIVKGAHQRGLVDITATVKELAGRAREGKLQPHEFQGGTFSVSNLGMFGVAEFSAVVNPPQAVIMAVGGGVRTVKPGKVGADGVRAAPRVATVLTARISVDRRVGDEALAGTFLQAFQLYMNQPHLLHL